MKQLLGTLALLLGLASLPVTMLAQSDINLAGYTLTFDDEFNTLSLTTSSPKGSANWYGLPPNGSAGYYSTSNWNANAFSVSNGILTDQAYYSAGWQSGYMASVDTTLAGFTQTYGYFEILCQMPNAGDGAWPSFWLDTTAGISGGQGNEEVDIFEWYGICNTPGNYQNLVQQTSHNWNTDGSQNTTTAPYLPSTSTPLPNGSYPWQGYHIYGCQIDPVNMTWYIDGVQTNRCATPTAYLGTPFFIIVDYALGGGWPLDGVPFTTDGSSSFLVDWVRVYSLPTVPPPAPTGLTGTAGNASVNLSWSFSQNATSYNVYRGTSAGGENATAIATGITATNYIDSGLANATTYYYKVAAVNSHGTSGYSNEASGTPMVTLGSIGVQFQGAGTALLTTDTAGLSSVQQINWNALAGASFTNQMLKDNSGSSTTVNLNGSANGTYVSTGISALPAGNSKMTSGELYNTWPGGPTLTFSNIPYAQYDVYVYADIDASGRSETVSLTPAGGSAQYYSFTTQDGGSVWTQGTNTWNGSGTAPTLPGANYVHFTGLTGSTFTLNWGAPSNGGLNGIQIVSTGAAVPTGLSATAGNMQVALNWTASSGATSYNIYRGTSAGGESVTAIVTGVTATSYTNTGLTNGTAYYYKVAALTSSGTSGYSNEASATPVLPVPSAPTGLGATAGNTQVALSWTASSGATSYNVYRGTSTGGESTTAIATGITTTSYTNTGLTNGTAYYYEVKAVNASGTSGNSNEASATPVLPVPSAPTGLGATAGNAQVALSWTASSGATSYNVYRGTSAGGESATAVATGITTTSYTNTGLTNGTAYYYEVKAVNASGTSGYSNEASATAASGAPSSPTGLGATATNAQVALNWTASSGATSYNVYRGTSAGGESATAVATGITTTSYTNTGLTNGTTYYYEVKALNASGTSGYSNEASATPTATGSGTSIGVQFQGAGTALLTTDTAGLSSVQQINWNVLAGATFTNQALKDNSGSSTTANLNGSANGTYFSTGISALPAGNSKMTSGELYNTWPGGPTLTFANIPYTQYDVYVYADIDASGRNETVSLTPAGGSAQYYSFTTQDGGSVWTQGTNTWNGSGTAPTLPGANYVHYTGLTASSFTLNWGAPSNGGLNGIQIVNTGGTPTAPSAPTGLGATAGNTQVALSWTASSGATSYNVYRGTSAGGESTTAIATGVTTTGYTNTGLTNGTAYYFEVKAVNASGSSGYSNEASATPVATGSGTSIGVQFQGAGTALLTTDTAGLSSVQQINWNVLAGATFTNQVLKDSSGSSTTANLNGSANGTYVSTGISALPAGNSKMTSGELYNTWPGGPTLTFASIPYTQYDVYVYADIDASGRNETVSLTPSGGSAQYYSFTTQDGGSVWTQGTNTWNGSGTAPTLPGANYVHYTGLTASSFTLNWGAPSNGGLNGIQIVNTGGTPTAPSAPTGLGATAGNTQVALGWTASSGATSYNVYRGTSAGGESATAIATGITTTSYTNTGLTNGTTYYFEVKAVNASGSSSYSNETSATPNATSSAITWGAAQNMVGTSDVSTTGAQFDATTFFGSAVSVNGVSFNPLAASGTLGGYQAYSDGKISANSPGGAPVAVPAFTTAAPSSVAYSNATSAIAFGYYSNGTVTLSGLTTGHTYQVQVWSWYTGSPGNAHTTLTGANTVTLAPETGQFAVGTFTASSSSLSFNYNYGIYYGVINAVSVRDISSGGGGPTAPTGLTATAGNTQVSLSWTASTGATSYNVYRGTSAGGESATAIATGITTTSYTNTGLTNGTAYYYTVSAVNASGTSGYSNEASATPASGAPSAPTGLGASAGNTQVALNWTASSGATSYNVYRGTSAGGESATPIVTGISTTSYTNTGLTNGTAYYYTVSAVNASGTSGYSNEANATPAAGGGGSNLVLAVGLERIVASYNGPAIRVQRPSDNTQQDIGFAAGSNALDTSAVSAFLGTSQGWITMLYDQSGSGDNVMAPASTDNMPTISMTAPTAIANGGTTYLTARNVIMPYGPNGEGNYRYFILPTSVSVDKSQMSVFLALRPDYSGGPAISLFEVGNPTVDAVDLVSYGNTGLEGMSHNSNVTFTNTNIMSRSQPTVLGMVTSPGSAPTLYLDGVSHATGGTVPASAICSGGYLMAGEGTGLYYYYTDALFAQYNFLGFALYNGPVSSGSATSISNAMLPHAVPTINIVADGDSITQGVGSIYGYEMIRYVEPSLNHPADITNIAIGGAPASSALTHVSYPAAASSAVGLIYSSSYAKNIYYVAIGTNDIHGNGTSGAQTWGIVQQTLQDAKAMGYKTIVATILHETGETTAISNEVENFNTLARAAVGQPYLDAVVDYNADSRLGNINNYYPTYSGDGIHPNDAGYQIMGTIAAPVFNNLIGP